MSTSSLNRELYDNPGTSMDGAPVSAGAPPEALSKDREDREHRERREHSEHRENGDSQIHLVTAPTVQNVLFVEALSQIAAPVLHHSISKIASDEGRAELQDRDLLLVDLAYLGAQTAGDAIAEYALSRYATVAVFNAARDLDSAARCVSLGVRGIFYADDPPNLIFKGVRTVLEGAVWIERDALYHAATYQHPPERDGESEPAAEPPEPVQEDEVHSGNGESALTPREREILGLISTGATNAEIAEELFITTSTVKSHIYNAFRKIHASNRLQAALWVAQKM